MELPRDSAMPDRASTSAYSVKNAIIPSNHATGPALKSSVPKTSPTRLAASLQDRPFDLDDVLNDGKPKPKTVLYLAYGSNLCRETFRGKRGIVPLSNINVQVPSLRLTFDLPGVPYAEPCFANSALRNPALDPPSSESASGLANEKTTLLSDDATVKKDYRKNAWHKSMIGVVYEVTMEDYAHIIATEGGGSSYQDVLVECHPFESDDPTQPVPQIPTTPPFKAHTLFAPATNPGAEPARDGGRLRRPDPSYAQPSARYLKLIRDGAAEHALPDEYRDYLESLRSYTMTTKRQRAGLAMVIAVWMPIVFAMFAFSRTVAGKDGKVPKWMQRITAFIFRTVWVSYDKILRPVFGDGERTIGDDPDVDHSVGLNDHLAWRRTDAASGQ